MAAAAAFLAAGLAGSGTTLLFVASGLALLAVVVVALEVGFGNTPREETLSEAIEPDPAGMSDDDVFEERAEPEPPVSEPPETSSPEPA